MVKTLNVLSIDWDYFIDADATYRYMNFPEGGEFNPFVEDMIWSGRYATSELNNNSILNKGIKERELGIICDLLRDYRGTGVYGSISTSHEKIIQFLNEIRETEGKVKFNIVNIDFHHDMYKNGNTDDCGNWAYRLEKHYKMLNSYLWIKQQDSDEPEHKKQLKGQYNESTDINDVTELEYDAIFICKSNLWSPPHLDNEFINLWESLTGEVPENDIFRLRYNDEFKNNMQQQINMYGFIK